MADVVEGVNLVPLLVDVGDLLEGVKINDKAKKMSDTDLKLLGEDDDEVPDEVIEIWLARTPAA